MMIAARNAFLISGEKLPYDAEVEYLESTGTQYINTMYYPNNMSKVEYRCYSISSGVAVGCISGYAWRPSFALTFDKGVSPRWGNNANTSYVPFNWRGVDIEVEQDRDCALNGNIVRSYADNAFQMQYPLILFDRSEISRDPYEGRLYWVRVSESSVLVRDLIPVRVGSGSSAVGYLYDRANPDGGPLGNGLYGNAGTGAFVIGPDK